MICNSDTSNVITNYPHYLLGAILAQPVPDML